MAIPEKVVVLRLPASLTGKIDELARASYRSRRMEIRKILEDAVESAATGVSTDAASRTSEKTSRTSTATAATKKSEMSGHLCYACEHRRHRDCYNVAHYADSETKMYCACKESACRELAVMMGADTTAADIVAEESSKPVKRPWTCQECDRAQHHKCANNGRALDAPDRCQCQELRCREGGLPARGEAARG